ncbi:MAG TPA: hypothetical protein VG326_12340 [Tepidisphaeraceae bacterium]|jgi:hypothetical protein|nr:hypothetical protein [Tepidisphaeraceae bacterium]
MRLFSTLRVRTEKSAAVATAIRRSAAGNRPSSAVIESLEPREMMSATVDGAPWCGTVTHHPLPRPSVVVVFHA